MGRAPEYISNIARLLLGYTRGLPFARFTRFELIARVNPVPESTVASVSPGIPNILFTKSFELSPEYLNTTRSQVRRES